MQSGTISEVWEHFPLDALPDAISSVTHIVFSRKKNLSPALH